MPTDCKDFTDLASGRPLLCWKEIVSEKGVIVTHWHVMQADGFMFDCGFNKSGNARATALQAALKAHGADQ